MIKKTIVLFIFFASLLVTIPSNADALSIIVKPESAFAVPTTSMEGVYTVQKLEGGYWHISATSSALSALENSGYYESIEVDVELISPNPVQTESSIPALNIQQIHVSTKRTKSSNSLPNDTGFSSQWYWHPATKDSMGSDLLGAVNMHLPIKKPRIGVVDGDFNVNDDVTYSLGYDVRATTRGPIYNWPAGEEPFCNTSHGLGVTAILGAKKNNLIGIAGIVDADIVVARALECGKGSIISLADGVRWLAGGEVNGLPVIDKVDVINISVGGNAARCSAYLQNAINFANTQGVVLIASAGNDNKDVAGVSPANCNHVITVGSSDAKGHLAHFSNNGEMIDLVAPGVNIAIPYSDGNLQVTYGTSFSAPMVSGAVALAKAEYPTITPLEVEQLLRKSASRFSIDSNVCDNSMCGDRILNASAFILLVRNYMSGKNASIEHALANGNTCGLSIESEFFKDSLCNRYIINFDRASDIYDDVEYQLFEAPTYANTVSEDYNLIFTGSAHTISMTDINTDISTYAYRTCIGGKCSQLQFFDLKNAIAPQGCR